MSPSKKIEVESDTNGSSEESEGRQAVEEEGSALSPSPELEEALREAAAAVDDAGRTKHSDPDPPAAGEAEVSEELSQTQDRLLRLQADYENFRRRAQRERTEGHQYGHQNLVKDLLSTVDNLERAIDHAEKSGAGDLESLLQGVELVHRELLAALHGHGVVRVEALGKPFDPNHHEAMAQAPDGSVAPNTVIEELQTGYLLRDRLLRPSRVVVAKSPEGAEETDRADSGGGAD